MQTLIAATPFGRRSMTLGQFSRLNEAADLPGGLTVDKWTVFRSVRIAKEAIGATDRALAILNALLSFYPDAELSSKNRPIVWPSNKSLTTRANGMPPSTLRRHLSVLVQCGLIVRRDSPNGKRFARKSASGDVEQVYGFDLSPLVARADELHAMAEDVESEKRAFKVSRERLTLLRRDIVKMIDLGVQERAPANWSEVSKHYQDIIGRLPRTPSKTVVDAVCKELEELWTEVHELLETFVNTQNPDGNESHNERHIQDSSPDPHIEIEHGSENKRREIDPAMTNGNLLNLPERQLPLGIVLDACPALIDLMPAGAVRSWKDFLATAQTARSMLDISPSAWRDAVDVMGDVQAAITVSAILQRSHLIVSAGGYLRTLTEKARLGQFSTWPMIMALLRAKHDPNKGDGRPAAASTSDNPAGESDIELSRELMRQLTRSRHEPR
ncbi:plasmid replication protein RepC [Notoacmeibacter ruber]|uniref:Replication initiation protein RepC n=1 Tax=Notoacmeibacter ruber TaxID=2670375 RepID=A0A3L7J3D9_9HYPH|nr:plasmid replication protein RepC [Notoacmeibacter ruber]RLQ84990.1 replication initiation protein RepC [Notoacmeibacter ruber]